MDGGWPHLSFVWTVEMLLMGFIYALVKSKRVFSTPFRSTDFTCYRTIANLIHSRWLYDAV